MPSRIPFRNPETARARIPHGSWLPPLKSTFSSAGSWASRQNRRSFPRRRVISLTFWRSLTQRPTRAGPFGSTRMSIWVGIGRRIKAKVGAFIEVLFISPPSQSTPLVTLKTAADNASKLLLARIFLHDDSNARLPGTGGRAPLGKSLERLGAVRRYPAIVNALSRR